MKKLVLPLLLLLGISMLLAQAVSEPSEVVGYVKYECAPGLNFIALPLNNEFATTEELGAAYPEITSIQKWTGDSWYSVNYDIDWGWDGSFDLDDSSVLFVGLENPVNIYSLGSVQSTLPQFDFTVGLNPIYLPLSKSSITDTELLGQELPAITSIQKWTGDSWYSVNYDIDWGWDGAFDLSIGMPIFISLDSPVDPWPTNETKQQIILRSSK